MTFASDYAPLFQAVCARPDDHTAKLVLADCCGELNLLGEERAWRYAAENGLAPYRCPPVARLVIAAHTRVPDDVRLVWNWYRGRPFPPAAAIMEAAYGGPAAQLPPPLFDALPPPDYDFLGEICHYTGSADNAWRHYLAAFEKATAPRSLVGRLLRGRAWVPA